MKLSTHGINNLVVFFGGTRYIQVRMTKSVKVD